MHYPTIDQCIGNTRLVRLQRMPGNTSNTILAKLEGDNPAGSVKDRPAVSMIKHAQARGEIAPGDHLIEATSGNTGIALAMVAKQFGIQIELVMPENSTKERIQTMEAYGAKVTLTPTSVGIEGSREYAENIVKELLDYYSVKKIYIIDAHFSHREWVKKYPINKGSALIRIAITE